MADHAAKFLKLMGDRWMLPERLGRSAYQRAAHVHVAAFAPVNNSEFWHPRLANSGMKALHQRYILPLTRQAEVRFLIVAPVTEIIFCRSHRQGCQQYQADHAKHRNFTK